MCIWDVFGLPLSGTELFERILGDHLAAGGPMQVELAAVRALASPRTAPTVDVLGRRVASRSRGHSAGTAYKASCQAGQVLGYEFIQGSRLRGGI